MSTRSQQQRYLTAAQLAEHYGVTRQHVYNLMQRGMPSVLLGRCRRFDPEATDAWVASETERQEVA